MKQDEIGVMVCCVDCDVVIGHRKVPVGRKEALGLCWECGLAREANGEEVKVMTVICSWCGKLLKQLDHENVGMISFGICDGCGEKLKRGDFDDDENDLPRSHRLLPG